MGRSRENCSLFESSFSQFFSLHVKGVDSQLISKCVIMVQQQEKQEKLQKAAVPGGTIS